MEPVSICSTLFALSIVGAYEFRPGLMLVEQFNPQTGTTEELIVYTDDYLSCWEDGVPVRQPGSASGGRSFTTPNTWFSFYMEHSKYKQRRIAKEIEDAVYAYHVYPHMAMVPDWFLRYWDLAEAICDYFGIPFDKPTLTDPAEFEALKVKIEKTQSED